MCDSPIGLIVLAAFIFLQKEVNARNLLHFSILIIRQNSSLTTSPSGKVVFTFCMIEYMNNKFKSVNLKQFLLRLQPTDVRMLASLPSPTPPPQLQICANCDWLTDWRGVVHLSVS